MTFVSGPKTSPEASRGEHGVGHLAGRPGHGHANRVCHGASPRCGCAALDREAGQPIRHKS